MKMINNSQYGVQEVNSAKFDAGLMNNFNSIVFEKELTPA
jgi:hypothetical protein